MWSSIFNSTALQPIIMGQLRHYVTVAGASLATSGYLAGSDVEKWSGAVMVLLSLVLSAISKKIAG